MSKWVIIGLFSAIILGLGAWIGLDPQARIGAARLWTSVRGAFGQVGAETNFKALWQPVASAFSDFADSVGGLWSGAAIHIELPSIQLPR